MPDFESRNPATEEVFARYPAISDAALSQALERAQQATRAWGGSALAERERVLRAAARVLRENVAEHATLITREMGKPIAQAEAEVKKCASACDHYAEHGERYLAAETIESDADRSEVRYEPLGVVLAVMPWNFPYWQVFRFAAPALMAGNGGLLKHAENVPGCGDAIEAIFRAAGLPDGVFQHLRATREQVPAILGHAGVRAATLTGSERAGAAVAKQAGAELKKTVLELGGSDPFLVLDDAPLEAVAAAAVKARTQNAGQSCIAAKRFIVMEGVADAFVEAFRKQLEALRVGDPMDRASDLGPLAREDLREQLHEQVERSRRAGARVLCGGELPNGKGWFYPPTLVVDAPPDAAAACEETFGPVALVERVASEDEAVAVANRTPYGLGSSVWSADPERALALAPGLEAGSVFVNGIVASDPRLPFGGVKRSGYGRELGRWGMHEFVNTKTVWMRRKPEA